ncbi:MAG: magnesium transporter, partial [Muribaculaceae bacterium]|nr:magnesium transporter [Muribaculaceae bacterium]
MKEYSPEYLENIRRIIAEGDVAAARRELDELHPADIAELYQDLDIEQAEFLYKLLDEETAADLLLELDEDERHKLLEALPNDVIAKQVDHMDTVDAADVLQE